MDQTKKYSATAATVSIRGLFVTAWQIRAPALQYGDVVPKVDIDDEINI